MGATAKGAVIGSTIDPLFGGAVGGALGHNKSGHRAQGPGPVSSTNTTTTFNPLDRPAAATGQSATQSMWNPAGMPTAWNAGAQGKGTPPTPQGAASDTTRTMSPTGKG